MTEQDPRAAGPPSSEKPTEPPAPPPQPPYGYPPPYQYPYQVPPPFNTYAILAAILAFLVLPPLGIYFGNKAKQQIAQTGERGIELAEVGVIAGWILTCLYGAFLIVWCGFVVVMFGGFLGGAVATIP